MIAVFSQSSATIPPANLRISATIPHSFLLLTLFCHSYEFTYPDHCIGWSLMESYVCLVSPFVHIAQCSPMMECISAPTFVDKYYSLVWLYYISYIHWSTDDHSCCFHTGVIINNASINNLCIWYLCGYMLSILLSIQLQVELLGHIVTLYLTFWETANLFSKVVYHALFPISKLENSNMLSTFM